MTENPQREHSPLPPARIGVYAVECPDCHARPGEWCRAIYTLPQGTYLSHAHDDRITEAHVQRKL